MAPELWSKVDEGRGRLVYSEDGTPLVFSENMEDGTPLGYDSSVDMCANASISSCICMYRYNIYTHTHMDMGISYALLGGRSAWSSSCFSLASDLGTRRT